MALDNEEMNKRRERREAQKKQQKRARARLKASLITAVIILALGSFGIYKMAQKSNSSPAQALSDTRETTPETTKPSAATKPTEAPEGRAKKDPITKIHIKAAGDLNVTNSVVQSGLGVTGYDFTRPLMDVAAVLSDADVTVMNLEGGICGEPFGTTTASAPIELLTSLRAAGVDMVQMANSYTIYNGLIGLTSTLDAIRNSGLEPLGAYSTPAQFKQTKGYTICNIQGIKVAFVAFTKGVGGMGVPAGNESCVNLLYKDYDSTYKSIDTAKITSILNSVASEKPDITVAMLHWGSENNNEISKTQNSIVSLMKKNGVDIILGTHPHLVQKIEFDQKNGTLVAYSLGDFYGDGSRGGTNYSIILDIEITQDADLKTTRVTGYSYTPIYTVKEDECDGFRRVVRIKEAITAYEKNYVDKVSRSTYEAMIYSLERIEARIAGESNTKQ